MPTGPEQADELIYYPEGRFGGFVTGIVIIATAVIGLIYLFTLPDRSVGQHVLIVAAVIGLAFGVLGIVAIRRRYPRLYLTPDYLAHVAILGPPIVVDLTAVGKAHIAHFGSLERRIIRPPYLFLVFHQREEEQALAQSGSARKPVFSDAAQRIPLLGLIGTDREKAEAIAGMVNERRRAVPASALPPDRARQALAEVNGRRLLWICATVGIAVILLIVSVVTG